MSLEGAGGDGLSSLVDFGRHLRAMGLPVGTGRILTFCRAVGVLAHVAPLARPAPLAPVGRDELYWAGRASLIARREDIEAFDRAFEEFFRRDVEIAPVARLALSQTQVPDAVSAELPENVVVEAGLVAGRWRAADEDEQTEGEASLRIVASAVEVLREKSFTELTEEERARTARLIRQLEVTVPLRSTRRTLPVPRGPRFDMRRTLRRSLRTQGEPFHRAWRERGRRARPLVLILDISGSMAPYSRALLQFAYAAMAAGRRVEAFCFGTRLTRVTRTLRTKNPDRALHEIGRQVEDWEGGTRIGESLKELLDVWSQRTALRGAVVVLCSDGLERGDPDLLHAQMARLRRLAHKVVWVNPLKGSPRYEPLARGMAAALPSIDVFLPGHNLESLEALGRVLG